MTNYEIHLMRVRGFAAGSGKKPIDPEHAGNPEYIRGYTDGQDSFRDYSTLQAFRLGVRLNEIYTNQSAE